MKKMLALWSDEVETDVDSDAGDAAAAAADGGDESGGPDPDGGDGSGGPDPDGGDGSGGPHPDGGDGSGGPDPRGGDGSGGPDPDGGDGSGAPAALSPAPPAADDPYPEAPTPLAGHDPDGEDESGLGDMVVPRHLEEEFDAVGSPRGSKDEHTAALSGAEPEPAGVEADNSFNEAPDRGLSASSSSCGAPKSVSQEVEATLPNTSLPDAEVAQAVLPQENPLEACPNGPPPLEVSEAPIPEAACSGAPRKTKKPKQNRAQLMAQLASLQYLACIKPCCM